MSGGMLGKTSTAGGISEEQKALAQYNFGQGALGAESQFSTMPGGGGMGPSTNLTQAIGGSRFKEAKDLAGMSDKDFQAMVNFNNQQAQGLQSLVSQVGGAIGGAGGGGGGGGGGGVG